MFLSLLEASLSCVFNMGAPTEKRSSQSMADRKGIDHEKAEFVQRECAIDAMPRVSRLMDSFS